LPLIVAGVRPAIVMSAGIPGIRYLSFYQVSQKVALFDQLETLSDTSGVALFKGSVVAVLCAWSFAIISRPARFLVSASLACRNCKYPAWFRYPVCILQAQHLSRPFVALTRTGTAPSSKQAGSGIQFLSGLTPVCRLSITASGTRSSAHGSLRSASLSCF